MIRIIKRTGLVLFWEIIILLFLFVIKKTYYIHWLIFSLVFLFFIICLSMRIIPSKSEEANWSKLLIQFKKKQEQKHSFETNGKLLTFSCPACDYASHFWEFLNQEKCPKCDSKLWTTVIREKGKEYYDLFEKFQEIEKFLKNLGLRARRKLNKMASLEKTE